MRVAVGISNVNLSERGERGARWYFAVRCGAVRRGTVGCWGAAGTRSRLLLLLLAWKRPGRTAELARRDETVPRHFLGYGERESESGRDARLWRPS